MNRPLAPETDCPRLGMGIVLASIVGLWLFYFLITSVRGSIVELGMEQELLWRRGVVCLAGIAVTIVLWQCLRLVDRRGQTSKIVVALLVALPGSLAIAQVNQMIFAEMQERVMIERGEKQGVRIRRDEAGNILMEVPTPFDPDSPLGEGAPGAAGQTIVLAEAPKGLDKWRPVVDIALGRYFLLIAWAALYLALLAGAQARAAERREERFRSAAKAAELRSLRYQVNPHFLFNTLNSLSALVMTGKAERAEQMIQTISRFYRHSLADDSTGDVTLEDEIDLQEHYLAIESVRFPERLRVSVDLPSTLAGYKVPGMILQPLVENSVKYGVSASASPVTVSITAREEFGRLVLTVADDGRGGGTAQAGLGIGLANVRDRLEARFGEAASIVSGKSEDGYRTELRLPLVKHG